MSMIQTGIFTLSGSGASELTNGDTSTFKSITFDQPFPDGAQVIVVPMLQSFNGSESPGVRLANVSTTGFQIRMNELVVKGSNGKEALSDGSHKDEICGWIAFTN